MDYLERILCKYAVLLQVLICGFGVIAYLFLAPFISDVILHLIVMVCGVYWICKKGKKIRKRIIKYIFVLLERAQNSGRSHPENFDEQEYAPIGFQQQIHPDDLDQEEDYDENREDKFKPKRK